MPADNTLLNAGAGGETIRSLADVNSINWPVGVTGYATTVAPGANVIAIVTPTNGLPVQPQTGSTWAVSNASLTSLGSAIVATGAAVPANVIYLGGNDSGAAIGLLADSNGRLRIDLAAASITSAVPVKGEVAHDSPASVTAILNGGYASASAPADVSADGDVAREWVLRNGSQVCNLAVGGTLVTGAAGLPVAQQGAWSVSSVQSGAWSVSLTGTTLGAGTLNQIDYDTGIGVQNMPMVGLALPGAGGAVAGGTSGNPIRTDPTGTTTQPVSGTVSISGNPAANIAQIGGTAVDANSGNVSAGTIRVVLATNQPQLTNKLLVTADPITFASAQPVTQSGTWTVQPGNTANTTPWLVTDTPATSGGLTPYKLISAATTNATSVKASAGQLYGIQVFSINAAARYLKLYDKASAPTVGTDTPVKVILIPGNTAGAGAVHHIEKGVAFANGIAFALTTGIQDSDTAAVAANEIVVNLDYK